MPPNKPASRPPNKPPVMLCSRCKRLFNSCVVGQCPHPAVNQCYGDHICMYCCLKCKHHKKIKSIGGITCGYGGDING